MDLITLPNRCNLWWRNNGAGGRTYYTDENGIDMIIWDTALTGIETLICAINQENHLRFAEAIERKKIK